ncbi:hypothetical protein [Streptomyces sp. NPDC014995]|uniref:hypothetical protein n=1 Tax=Streptomyces sp. NPDC014995 TaxID=3364936 RepID=UPI0036FF6449
MSTPPENKPKTPSERLDTVESDIKALKADADQTAKVLEHAQVWLKPEAVGAAMAATLVAGGITLLAPAFAIFKAELPTIKDFTPQIHAYVDRKFGWTSDVLKAERALERRLTAIEVSVDLHGTKIVQLRRDLDAAARLASAADTRSRENSRYLSRQAAAVQRVGSRRPVDATQVQDARQVAQEVRRMEFHVNSLIAALAP